MRPLTYKEAMDASDNDKLKIGDTVMSRYGEAKIVRMELTDGPREKYGQEIEEVSWHLVELNLVMFDLDNGHWSYSENISRRTS